MTGAVAKKVSTPHGMVSEHRESFAQVLPSQVNPNTWVRVAQGALRKGRKQGNAFELEIAAANNPTAFLSAMLDAARLGLEPGTPEYYLTPRKVKGRLEILGVIGYQGLIELMYRAGYVSSVVAECVYTGDRFDFLPGQDETPNHRIDWDSDDRGKLRLVYAYARMREGGTSKVVVMNRTAIARIKASSGDPDGYSSPWVKHEDSMWLKSAVRQLAKWIPTSAEIRSATPQNSTTVQPSPSLDAQVEFDQGSYIDGDVADVTDLPEIDPTEGETA